MFCFFHVTKTAGMSLTKIVTTCLSRSFLYENHVVLSNNRTRYRSRPLVQSPDTDAAKYFTGHLVYYGMHEDIQRPGKYILFLRDPVQRIISLYHHDNIETVRNERPFPNFTDWIKANLDKTMIHGITSGSKFPATLDGAIKILERTAFIGLQETFALDVQQLFYRDIIIPHENVTEKRKKKIFRNKTQ